MRRGWVRQSTYDNLGRNTAEIWYDSETDADLDQNRERTLSFEYDAATDTTSVANHLVYDAFGNVTDETAPAVASLFLFTGRPFDPETGLQNNLKRWYDGRVGQWVSEDPIGFLDGANVYE